MTSLDNILKSRDTTLSTQACLVKCMVFPVVMDVKVGLKRKLSAKELILLLEMTFESPLDCKVIQPVNSKENQSWIFIGRTDPEAETLIFWPTDVKNWLIGKDPDAGKDWRREEKGTTEDEMVGWHHLLNGHEFEQAPGVRDGQGRLMCCSLLGHKELDMTEQLNWTEGYQSLFQKEGDVTSL